MWGSALALPGFALSMLITNNFYLSMFGYGLKYLFGENFWSPNITMIQKTTPSNKFGSYMSAYQCFTIMSGCASTLLMGFLINYLGIAKDPVALGKVLAGVCSFAYAGSIVAWSLCKKNFLKFTEQEAPQINKLAIP